MVRAFVNVYLDPLNNDNENVIVIYTHRCKLYYICTNMITFVAISDISFQNDGDAKKSKKLEYRHT